MVSTVNKGYDLPATGSLTGTWGQDLNAAVFTVIDNNLGGVFTIPLSSANVVVSAANAQNCIYRLTGSLSADVIVTLPCYGFLTVENLCSGNFLIYVSNGVGLNLVPPVYSVRHIISDRVNGMRAVGLPPPGTILDNLGANGGGVTFHRSYYGEYLPCDGSAISRIAYPGLLQAIGLYYGQGDGSTTFNLPDLRGRVRACLDNGANRLTILGGLGGAGGEQSHQLTLAEMPSHNHGGVTGNDSPDHSHGYLASPLNDFSVSGGSGKYQATSAGSNTAGANQRHQHSIPTQGSDGAHNNLQPTMMVFTMIKT